MKTLNAATITAYDIIVDLAGHSIADEIVFALQEEGFIIIPEEDEATDYEISQRDSA